MKATRWTVLSLLFGFVVAGSVGCGGGSPARAPASPGYGYGPPGAAPEAPADEDWGGEPAEAESYPQGAPPPATEPSPARGGYGADHARTSPPGPTTDPFELRREKQQRPGLATQWGENRYSRVSSAPFVRASFNQPFAAGKLFYNDRAGIDAMASLRGSRRYYTDRFSVGGYLDVGLRNESGYFYQGFNSGGNNYVTGEVGRRYTILVRNHTPGRIEAVISVDGLDVIDGRGASYSKRGYLLDPHGRLEIEGFRRSETQVASFRFGSVSQSYAARKHGDTRNVGVIGFAFFHERGDDPRYWRPGRYDDSGQRHSADPFPQQYATPPR